MKLGKGNPPAVEGEEAKAEHANVLSSMLLMHSSAPWVTWRNNAQLVVFIE